MGLLPGLICCGSLTPIGFRAFDHLLAHPATNRKPGFDIAAEMDPRPEPRFPELLRPTLVTRGLAREEVTEHKRRSHAEGRRVRDVAWEVGVRDDRGDGRVELIGARRPIVELRVLRGNPRIIVGHMHQRVGARGSRRVSVEAQARPVAGRPRRSAGESGPARRTVRTANRRLCRS